MDLNADVEGLLALGRRLTEVAAQGDDAGIADPLSDLLAAAEQAGAGWSGSPFGYHSRVYYRDFERPPPGARFSMEWGFMPMMSTSTAGDWVELDFENAIILINQLAGNPNLHPAVALDVRARETWDDSREDALSILTAIESTASDDYIQKLKIEITELSALTEADAHQAQMASGQRMTRDAQAANEGMCLAPHQAVIAQVAALKASTSACAGGAKLINRLAQHLVRQARNRQPVVAQSPRIFIGHGGSAIWRELKDFVNDRLGLPWDEFNREPIAGITNVDRLTQMLDGATVALLVLTAEDEQADSSMHPRLNVVHEAGLFQGRLGFARAIVLVEESCQAFSNIEGLGQIRFPPGNISAAFEKVREVLEREGVVSA